MTAPLALLSFEMSLLSGTSWLAAAAGSVTATDCCYCHCVWLLAHGRVCCVLDLSDQSEDYDHGSCVECGAIV